MTTWSADELDRLGEAWQIEISSSAPDGGFRAFVPIWMVRLGDRLVVRSSHGAGAGWFRHASGASQVRVRADGETWDVTLEPTELGQEAVDDAYRSKYAVSGAAWIADLLSPGAVGTTREVKPV
ncbi:DUF2255 family protein [Herbiconiux moechotypicola]|uniref:DUF2255 family protein n=1 Tax=Herbiconiux moechotypicola TaxID=637393 RepID=A0ABN3DED8_9MICO|nr:DUF2255 family protein [Herbiconiux moechotypicola]MCS5729303.1 DUF2255 family protein [Herbiconiux moechotypicola]